MAKVELTTMSAETVIDPLNDYTLMYDDSEGAGNQLLLRYLREVELVIAVSDETTSLTTGTGKVTFRMPFAMTLFAGNAGVRGSVNLAPTGSTIIVDVNEGAGAGTTILSTKLSIDASEFTSLSAASTVVVSDTSLADDANMTIDIDQIGSTIPGKGLKVVLRGYKT